MHAPRRALTGLAAAALALSLALTAGCSAGASEQQLQYETDYSNHPHLEVTGYPTTETLGVVQRVVWGMADGTAERLADLAHPEGSDAAHRATAADWIREYRKGAQGKVTAEFQDDPMERQSVQLTFHDTGQATVLDLRPDIETGWRVVMK
ncbi:MULTISPECIES: hypothetical protein [Kitasatospora]|uniref:Uncharacterized protein n=1 Tax=Kitasatospora arboriphila TaxID=258052 RepID=A0ABN1TSF1_9ACTN